MKFFSTLFLLYCYCAISAQTPISVLNGFQINNPLLAENKLDNQIRIVFHDTSIVEFTTHNPSGIENPFEAIYAPQKDPKRLIYDTGILAGAAVISFGILWSLPENATNWNRQRILNVGLTTQWKRNVTKKPIWDEDSYLFNWVMHPWAGGVYYMNSRGSGYNEWQSFGYSALMSTFFWEYGFEAFAEDPSIQDLIFTPVLGSLVGELFFRWKGDIVRNDRKLLHSKILGNISLFLMDPFNELVDGFGYKTKNKIKSYSLFTPIDLDTNKTTWGMHVFVVF